MPTATATPSDTFSALVAPLLDEELVALQTFLPGGRWKSPFRRYGRKLIGRGRLDDALPTLSLLAVTATRVSVRGVAYGYDLPGGMQILDPLGDWPRDQVSGTTRTLTMSVLKDDWLSLPGATHDLDVRRATLQTPDGPFVADLPAHERATIRICKELGLKREKR